MVGPPGSGKTTLAKRLAGILPPLAFPEALETTQVHSVAGMLPNGAGLLNQRPLRAPHHTISDAGMIGGGLGIPRPGEISLAHNGCQPSRRAATWPAGARAGPLRRGDREASDRVRRAPEAAGRVGPGTSGRCARRCRRVTVNLR